MSLSKKLTCRRTTVFYRRHCFQASFIFCHIVLVVVLSAVLYSMRFELHNVCTLHYGLFLHMHTFAVKYLKFDFP